MVALFVSVLAGIVVEDLDGDGLGSPADQPVAGVVVALDARAFATTAQDGSFRLEATGPGIVWVRVPDGFRPRPTYAVVDIPDRSDILLVLERHEVAGPLRFVHASDAHLGAVSAHDLERALRQATSGLPVPHFLALSGDATQSGSAGEFDSYRSVVLASQVPLVTSSGNHDVYDGGVAWMASFGPAFWSFDAGGVHFVVLSGGDTASDRVQFLLADANFTPPDMPVAALLHYALSLPHDQALYETLVAVGVRWLFSGHYHANRTLEYDELVEFNVQPFVFGGMDGVPSGYQLVTIADGRVTAEHFTVTEDTVFEIVHPRPEGCLPTEAIDVVVDAMVGPGVLEVEVSLDGGSPLALAKASSWSWQGRLHASPGSHRLTAFLRHPPDQPLERSVTFCVSEPSLLGDSPTASWSQLGGDPTHQGTRARAVVPPLIQRWASAVGGGIKAPPVLDDGRLFVPSVDLGTGADGGLVALEAATGQIAWAHRVGGAVHGPPAVSDGVVVYVGLDGVVRALDARSGDLLWEHALGPVSNPGKRALHAGVAIAEGAVYAGGVYGFAALDLYSGTPHWERQVDDPPFPQLTYATPAVFDGMVVAPLATSVASVFAWRAEDGADAWQSTEASGMTASPVAADGVVLLSQSNAAMSAVRLVDGAVLWRKNPYPDAHLYAFWLRATPAVADGRVFVPTHRGELLVLALSDGAPLWALAVGTGRIHGVHYESTSAGINASPIVTGGVVWVGGDDGVLRAANTATGDVVWSMDLGSPISGLISGENTIYVSGWDGVVRALVAEQDGAVAVPAAAGCGCALGSRSDVSRREPVAMAIVMFALACVGRIPRRLRRGDVRPSPFKPPASHRPV